MALAVLNLASLRLTWLAVKTGPLPEKLGFGRVSPFLLMHAT